MKRRQFIYVLLLIAAVCVSVLFPACTNQAETTQLDAPANLTIGEDEVLTWDAVDGAEYYVVTVNDETDFVTSENEIDLFEVFDSVGDYTVSVYAGGTGSYRSDLSYTAYTVAETEGLRYIKNDDGESLSVIGYDATLLIGKVIIPSTYKDMPVTAVYEEGFAYCTGITGIIMPDSITDVGESAFESCTALERIKWSEKAELIPEYCFQYSGLKTFNMPDGVYNVDKYAFAYCASLESVTWSSHATEIPVYCFQYSGLKSFTVPDSVVEVGKGAFAYCASLESVTWSSHAAVIPTLCFMGCDSLQELDVPEGVTEVDSLPSGLKKIKLPSTLTEFSARGCGNVEYIEVAVGNERYKSDGNCLIETATDTLIWGGINSVIPSYVTVIGNRAYSARNMTSITIPSNISKIGAGAFANCKLLTEATFSEGLEEIEERAFYSCTSLTGLHFPESLKKVGAEVFSFCTSLKSVYYGKGVESIDVALSKDSIFYGYTATTQKERESLESVTVSEENLYYKSDGNCIILRADDTLISGCTNSVIPDYVKKIGDYAFAGCALNEITIPSSCKKIGNYAFYYCENLESITFRSGLEKIDAYAFAYSALNEVIIPESCNEIAEHAFFECDDLITLRLPYGLEKIGAFAFSSTPNIHSVVIPETVIEIGSKAFYTSASLYTVFGDDPDGWYYESESDEDNWYGPRFYKVFRNCVYGYDDGCVYPYVISFKTKEINFSESIIPERDGYEFTGWSKTEGAIVPDDNNIVFFYEAHWNVFATPIEWIYDSYLVNFTEHVVYDDYVTYYAVWKKLDT